MGRRIVWRFGNANRGATAHRKPPIGRLAFPGFNRCGYLSRSELLASSMRASAWWMLPFARFVFTTDFWPATMVTSVSKLWYPGNSTLIRCVPGTEQHGVKGSAQFSRMSQESVVHENGRAVRLNVNFQLSGHARPGVAGFFLHFDGNEQQFLGFHGKRLREVLITRLPNGEFVVARNQQDPLWAPQFAQISHVLAVNPHAGCFFHLRRAFKCQFPKNCGLRHQGRDHRKESEIRNQDGQNAHPSVFIFYELCPHRRLLCQAYQNPTPRLIVLLEASSFPKSYRSLCLVINCS